MQTPGTIQPLGIRTHSQPQRLSAPVGTHASDIIVSASREVNAMSALGRPTVYVLAMLTKLTQAHAGND